MQSVKKLLCLGLVFSMLLTSFCFVSADDTVPAEDTAVNDATSSTEITEAEALPTEFSDIDYDSVMGKAVDSLTNKGIISGYQDGTFKSDQTLTRAEFAKIIVCFKDASLSSSEPSGFPDVDDVGGSAHWAQSYIKIAKDMGIISGFPDGSFSPDAPVTYEQATKMILCSLGYTNLAYPQGYIQTAGQKRLFVNSTHKGATSDPITRGTTAILVNNAFTVPQNNNISTETPGTTGGGGGGSFGDSSAGGGGGGGGGGGNIKLPDDLIENPVVKTMYGVVWGTFSTMLDTTRSSLYENQISLLCEIKDKDTNAVSYEKKTYFFPESMIGKYDKYLGKYVKITLSRDDEGEEYVSKIDSNFPKKNYSVDIKLEDFIRFYDENAEDDDPSNDETQNYILSYYNSKDKKDTLKFTNPDELYVIYNGKSINTEEAEEYLFNPDFVGNTAIGSFKFLSYDGDKKIDVILVDSYKTAVVSSKNKNTGIITFLDGSKLDLTKNDAESDRESVILTDSTTGKNITISDITKYDVVDYKESLDGLLLSAYVTPVKSAASGSVSKIKFASEEVSPDVTRPIIDDDSFIEIKNSTTKKSYKFNPYFKESFNANLAEDKYIPMVDDTLKLYLDKDGKIAHMEYTLTTANSKYGYITDMAFKVAERDDEYITNPDDVTEEDIPVLKMYQISSKSYTKTPVPVASKVIVDGNIYRNNPVAVYERLVLAATVANRGKLDAKNQNMTFASFVRYEVTGSEITVIDTILDKEGHLSTETDDRYNLLVRSEKYVYDERDSAPGKLYDYGGQHIFCTSPSAGFHTEGTSKRFRVNSSTNILFVPGNRLSGAEYSVAKYSSSNFIAYMKYYVEAYNLDASNYAEFVLQYMTAGNEQITAYSQTSTLGVITEILDPDMDEVDEFTVKYRTNSSTSVLSILIKDDYPAYAKRDNLKAGDVILFSKSRDKTSIYDYYHSLDVNNLPVKRIDDTDLFYCKSNIDDRRIKGFATYPTDTTQDYTDDARYRTIYGTAVEYVSSDSTLIVNPALSTDYLAPDHNFDESFLVSSSTRLLVYDEDAETITAYTSSTATTLKEFLSGDGGDEQGLLTAADNGDSFEGSDHVFVYTSLNNTAKIIYVIRSSSQRNPAPYSDDVDVLNGVRQSAKNSLDSHVNLSLYEEIATAINEVIAQGKDAIDEAESSEAIEEATILAKGKMDAITNLYSYVAPDEYEEIAADLRTLVSEGIEAIKNAETVFDAETICSDYKNSIDEAIAALEEPSEELEEEPSQEPEEEPSQEPEEEPSQEPDEELEPEPETEPETEPSEELTE